jgi:MFS family permease
MSLSNKEFESVAQPENGGRLWHNRDYLLLWAGQAISTTGSSASELALPLLILSLTRSPIQAGLVGALRIFAMLLTSLPAGALVDRWNRKYTMMVCDTGRALALASIPLALAFGHLTAVQLYLVAMVEGTLATFFDLAQAASIPRVVRKEQLPAAVAQQEVTGGVVTLLGPSLGGVLYGLARPLPFLADAISYIASVCSLVFVRAPLQETRSRYTGKLHMEIAAGMTWLWRHPVFRSIALLMGGLVFIDDGMRLIIIVLAQHQGASSVTIGLIFGLGGIGGIVGALLGAQAEQRLSFGKIIIGAFWAFALIWPLFALAPSPLVIGIILACFWLVDEIYDVVQISYRRAQVPDALQGRVNSAYRLVIYSLIALGNVLTGYLLQAVGPLWTIALFAVFLVLLALGATLNVPVWKAGSSGGKEEEREQMKLSHGNSPSERRTDQAPQNAALGEPRYADGQQLE